MPCGPACACRDAEPPVECLAVVDPARFSFFRDWCHSGDELRRRHVLARSRIGCEPVPATPPAADARPTVPPPRLPPAGDLIEAAAKVFGADRLASWLARKAGAADCGCAGRRDKLNALHARLRAYLGRKPPA